MIFIKKMKEDSKNKENGIQKHASKKINNIFEISIIKSTNLQNINKKVKKLTEIE